MRNLGRSGVTLCLIVFLLQPWGTTQAGPEQGLLGLAVYVTDSDTDQVLRLTDLDGSGFIEPSTPGEALPFYDDSSPGPDLSVPSALLAKAQGGLYLLDGGTLDAVYVLEDLDGSGSANGAAELRIFYDDSSPGPNLATPGALAAGPEGALYIADDGKSYQRILRLADLDGDGDALDAGEWRVVYDKTALAPSAGALLDIEALACVGNGVLLAADSTLGMIYSLTDLDGDGDFLEADEVKVFFDPQGSFPFSPIQGLSAGPGGEVYAAHSATGLIVRCIDLDGDGSAMGAGEWTVFLDPAVSPMLRDAGDIAVAPDGTLVILDRKADAVILARDLDGDGTANGAGEAISWILDGGSLLSTPSAVAIAPAPPPPTMLITRLLPAKGPLEGGTRIQISGVFASPETAQVTFGGASALVVAAASGGIECLAPPAAREGAVDVRVSTAGGEAVLPGGFLYSGGWFTRGDANQDGAVDISDAVAVLEFLFLGPSRLRCQDAMDCDDDGALAITDAIFLLNYLFLGGDPVPPPGPGPGPDGTPDDLTCQESGT